METLTALNQQCKDISAELDRVQAELKYAKEQVPQTNKYKVIQIFIYSFIELLEKGIRSKSLQQTRQCQRVQ